MTSGYRLKKTSIRTHWRERLTEMLVAGGTLAAVGCSTSVREGAAGGDGGQAATLSCGNANPDPCICDRPKSDPVAAAECQSKRACEARGPDFMYALGGCLEYEPDYRLLDASPNPPDAAVFTIPCGNANADPCICDRPKTDPIAAAECKSEMACEAKGGVWGYSRGPEWQCLLPDAGSIDAGPIDAGVKD